MKQEEKQLLLKDICARLPYGVTYYHDTENVVTPKQVLSLTEINNILLGIGDNIKPYLRSISSMTEDEYKEFRKISGLFKKEEEGIYFSNHLSEWGNTLITERVMVRTIDWLNAHHFDYRGLIEKGLALEAPKNMYKND